MTADLVLHPIGVVESPLTDPAAAPKQGHEGSPDAVIVFDAAMWAGFEGVTAGDTVIALTWLDRADRTVLRVHPRDDPQTSMRGVFSTRSADRPNPIGIHVIEVIELAGGRMRVRNLEAVHGTPVLDIKPVI